MMIYLNLILIMLILTAVVGAYYWVQTYIEVKKNQEE